MRFQHPPHHAAHNHFAKVQSARVGGDAGETAPHIRVYRQVQRLHQNFAAPGIRHGRFLQPEVGFLRHPHGPRGQSDLAIHGWHGFNLPPVGSDESVRIRTKARTPLQLRSLPNLTIVKFMLSLRHQAEESRSLADVHSTVGTSQVSFWKRMFAFAGPAYLVSVGYMDPGNWATDLEGGARFGYQLLWVLVMSNAMAILLQTLSARLGIVRGRDLAQACRETYPRPVNLALWVLCEIAIAACDLAEVWARPSASTCCSTFRCWSAC